MSRVERSGQWRRIWIVALREIRERGGSRSYRISTVVALALVIAVIVLPSVLGSSSKTYHVGLTGTVPPGTVAAMSAQAQAVDHRVAVHRFATVPAGERALRDKSIDALVIDAAHVEWRTRSNGTLSAVIASAVQAVHIRQEAARLGISPQDLSRLLVPVSLTSRTIGAGGSADQDAQTVGLLAVGTLYIALSFYAGFVLTGVVQEKSNRVAEVLVARMPAREVLAGKVLGIGAVGLAQFALIAVTAAITATTVNDANAPHIGAGVLTWTVLWFILGYVFYSVVYAALGATTSRIEDAQSAVAPVTAALVLSYLAVIYASENPDAGGTVLLSYFPPTAPVVMTYRVAVSAAPIWQVLTSAAFMLAVTWWLIGLAGRIYSGALLRFGKRVPVRELWRSTRAS